MISQESFHTDRNIPGFFRNLILSPSWNRFHPDSRIDFRRPPFQEGFRDRDQFLWDFEAFMELLPIKPEVPVEGQPFTELRRGDSGSSSPGISTGIASDRISRYVRTRLPSEGLSDWESVSGWESQKN